MCQFVLLWVSFFPGWRYIARRHLQDSRHPRWWADLPGACAAVFGIIGVLAYYFYLEETAGQSTLTVPDWALVAALLTTALAYIAIFVACLRSSRPQPDHEVFD